MSIEVIGLKEANRALKRLPEFAKANVQQTINVTASQLYRAASLKAPRRTGLLRASLDWQARPRSLSAIVGARTVAYYWKFVEFGTVKMAARPFLRPAAEALKADHHARMVQTLEKAARQTERAQGTIATPVSFGRAGDVL